MSPINAAAPAEYMMIMGKRKYIFFFLVIIALLLPSCSEKMDNGIHYQMGSIYVNDFDFLSSTFNLDTEWEFYWGSLYTPDEFKSGTPELPGYINVPGVWNGYKAKDGIAGGDGFATYRLLLHNIPPGSYALKIPTMATAYRMWVNDKEVSSNGIVAEDKSMTPMQRPGVAFFDSHGGEISILVQVSNFMSDKGGIWASIYFGERGVLLRKRYISLTLEMMLFGSFMIMALYHFALYAFRKKNRFTLYFGFLCFVIGLRVILTGEFFLIYLFPGINWNLHVKAEIITVYAGFAFFILFLKNLYYEEFSASVCRFYIIVSLLFTLITAAIPIKISAMILPVYHILLIAGFIISIVYLKKAVKNRKEGAAYILWGSLILILVVMNDILDSNKLINTVYLFPYGLLFFIFSQSIILARIFSDSFSRVEDLSLKLGILYNRIDEDNKNLEIKINERTAELADANVKLQEIDRAKTDFFANISHELRTPLTILLAPIDDALKGESISRVTLEMMQRNGRNLQSLINDFLEISRITSGSLILNVSKIDINELVKTYCREMEPVSVMKGIALFCSMNPYPLYVYADRNRLAGIISNFFSNSFKFTEPGGKIEISGEATDGFAVINFSDTGCGISQESISTIFDRFYQGDSGSTGRYEGMGIGLSIVKQLVELHGGSVEVESKHVDLYPENHGTKFKVSIPLGKGHFAGREDVRFKEYYGHEKTNVRGIDLPSQADDQEDVSFPDDAPSILVVEDNADLRFLLVSMLREHYRIYEASSGAEALKQLNANEEIDLILSDIMMPQMDGYELFQRIRGDERFEMIPVVFLTARVDDFVPTDGLKPGGVDYITKPFNADDLRLRIENQIENKSLRNSIARNYSELMGKLRSKVLELNDADDNSARVKIVVTFINEHYKQSLDRKDIAEAAGFEPDTFNNEFEKYTGKEFYEYLNELRIGEACRLLVESNLPVARISIETGFDNVRTFNRAFKNVTGLNPDEYRDRGVFKN